MADNTDESVSRRGMLRKTAAAGAAALGGAAAASSATAASDLRPGDRVVVNQIRATYEECSHFSEGSSRSVGERGTVRYTQCSKMALVDWDDASGDQMETSYIVAAYLTET